MILELNQDCFASGQVGSKIWLCQQLEKIVKFETQQTLWLLGGWVGLLPFILQSRESLPIKGIRSFDIDEQSVVHSELVNDFWVWQQGAYRSFKVDCNQLDYLDGSPYHSESPDIIINTSTEHMESRSWWDNIPSGRLVVLQNTDMEIHDHINRVASASELERLFPLGQLYFSGELYFDYRNETSFKRFMTIGRR